MVQPTITQEENSSTAALLQEVQALRGEVERLTLEKNDLELMLETTTDHATEIESELQEKNAQVERYILALRREMQAGREIQANFLPQELPRPTNWELAAHFQPAREVAGDFYDAFELPGHRLGLVVADVCDKGVAAALFMSLTRTMLRVLAYQAFSRLQHLAANAESYLVQVPGGAGQPPLLLPAYTYEVLNAVGLTNEYIVSNHSNANMFATTFFGVLDIESGSLAYVNGGHDAPILFGEGGIRARLGLTGPAVGVIPGVSYKMRQIQLEPGDTLLIYTDGVPEARDPAGQFFTEKRLLNLIESYQKEADPTAGGLLGRIETEVGQHVGTAEPSDDVTMLAVRHLGHS